MEGNLVGNFYTRKLMLIEMAQSSHSVEVLSIYSSVSSGCQVQRMICLILSFQIGSNLLGLENGHLFRIMTSGLGLGIILLKKSAIKPTESISQGYTSRELLSGIRLLLKIQGRLLYPYKLQYAVSSIESSFSLIFVHLNLNRAGLAAMLNTNLYTLGFGLTSCRLIKLSLKRICDPRFNMIRALFVGAYQ